MSSQIDIGLQDNSKSVSDSNIIDEEHIKGLTKN